MIKWLMRDILEYPEVVKFMERTYHDKRFLKNIKRGFWLSGWYLKAYRKQKKYFEKHYNKIVKNGMVMNLRGKHSDINFYLPLLKLEKHQVKGDFIQRTIFMTEDYFDIRSLRWLKENGIVRENMNVLDIGANIGNHTVYFAKECNVNYIYSFEPVFETYKMLDKNCKLNGLENVSLHNFALGKEKASVKIKSFNKENCGGTALQYGYGGMDCYALDDLKIDKKIDFIKIDVEGFENEVLLGGMNIIKKNRPIIYVEIFEENRNKVDKTLSGLGYVLKERKIDDYLYLPR